MILTKNTINCQSPADTRNINRTFTVVDVSISKGSAEYNEILQEAKALANLVNSGAANDSNLSRDDERKLIDAFGGLLSERAWIQYLNSEIPDIASSTQFESASNQIDITLKNGEKVEVRSSFVRNGVKFGICSSRYNFKNIGPYSNSIKPGEIQKNFYSGVLFQSSKQQILSLDTITFSLVGSSTWDMMMRSGYDTHLNAYDGFALAPGNYRVVEYQHTLDCEQFIQHLKSIGY